MVKIKNPVILIDGSSYFYRAFHALPPLHNSKGEPTGAVFGVLNMIKKIIDDYQPSHLAVVFDSKGETFRDTLFPEYKANRAAMPDELSVQFQPLIESIEAMGIPVIMANGIEADDIIGTIVKKLTEKNIHIIISTGDKDFAQLVTDEVVLVNTMSNTVLDIEGVKNKFGIPPELIVDYLTLIGDSVDNVPGIPNVGPKTAVKWLQTYGNLANIVKHAHEITGKVGENLRAHLKNIPLSKQLVTIHQDCDISFTPELLMLKPKNREKLIGLFQHLEFRNWLDKLLSEEKQEFTPSGTSHLKFIVIYSEEELKNIVKQINESKLFSFDTETTNLNVIEAKLVGISLAVNEQACYIPIAHDDPFIPAQLPIEVVFRYLKPVLANTSLSIIGHNLKYDINILKNYDINIACHIYDSMLESYVLNSASSRHDMDSLALKYLGIRTIHYEEVAGTGAKQITFDKVPVEKAAPYAAEDAQVAWQLHHYLWPQLTAIEALKNVCLDIEFPLVRVLADMEKTGVLIDAGLLNKQSEELSKHLIKLEREAHESVGMVFNLHSPKQLQEILYGKLNIPIIKKTPTGQPSTAEDVLQELAYDYPLPKMIVEYRRLSKLKSTYTDALPLQISKKTGRVHTSYNQAVTSTGRLSSTDPNLQNIPIRTEEGRRIRQAFIAPPDYVVLSADYSQIELRIMAHMSGDRALIDAFQKGLDIHRFTASEVFVTPLDEVNAEQRRRAKAINFGLIYGMSSFGLAKQLGIDRHAADAYIKLYFTRYPGIKKYMEETREKAHAKGYVETLYGRRLYLPEISARNVQRQKAAERAAINAPLQGTAADIIKITMIKVHQWLKDSNIDARMIMQVHDELVFEVRRSIVKEIADQIRNIMIDIPMLSIPLEVGIAWGNNWDAAH